MAGRKHRAAWLLVLPLALTPAACGDDADDRSALREDELTRELDLAFQSDPAPATFQDTVVGYEPAPDPEPPPAPAPRPRPVQRNPDPPDLHVVRNIGGLHVMRKIATSEVDHMGSSNGRGAGQERGPTNRIYTESHAAATARAGPGRASLPGSGHGSGNHLFLMARRPLRAYRWFASSVWHPRGNIGQIPRGQVLPAI